MILYMSDVVVVLPFEPVMQIVEITACELDLRDDGYALFAYAADDRRRVWYARRLDHFGGREYQLLGMAALFVGHLPLIEPAAKPFGDLSRVGKKGVETLFLCQYRGAITAYTSA